MTKVQIFKTKEGVVRSFHCSGHSGYAEEGEDIVCAGISALVINTVNCLDDLLHEKIEVTYDEESGMIDCAFREAPCEKATFLIDCLEHGLTWIRQTYGDAYLSCEIEGV